MDIHVIPCQIPTSDEVVIYIPKIFWFDSYENLWDKLWSMFSHYGLLYKIFISPTKFYGNKNLWYAYIRYYSPVACKAALASSRNFEISGKQIYTIKPKNMKKPSRTTLLAHQAEELISYYFGFTSWSQGIDYLNKVDSEPDEVKFICSVCITTTDGLHSQGVGVGEAKLHKGALGTAYMTARRSALQNAKESAFSKFVIVELGDGRALLEVDTTCPMPYCKELPSSQLAAEVQDLEFDPEEELLEDLSDTQLDLILDQSV